MEEKNKDSDDLKPEDLEDLESIDPTGMGGLDHDSQIIELDDLESDIEKSLDKDE